MDRRPDARSGRAYPRLGARRGVALLAVLVTVAGLTALLGREEGREGFRVQGPRLYDPDGRPFVIRGVVLPYGTFAGGPGQAHDAINYFRLPSDLRRVRAAGANLVRVFTTPAAGDPDRFEQLEHAVALARRQGLVVQLATAFTPFEAARPWVRRLAVRFRSDPYVWIQPMNEPGCGVEAERAAGACGDWERWQREHRAYVGDIRAAGVTSPIVVNVPNYSRDLSPAPGYPLGDDQVLFGAHRYGEASPAFGPEERAAVEHDLEAPARALPAFVDEVGHFNGWHLPNQLAWSEGMTGWIAAWVRRGGLGATGFNWRWSDPNSMLGPDERLSPWGRAFVRDVLGGGARADVGPGATPRG